MAHSYSDSSKSFVYVVEAVQLSRVHPARVCKIGTTHNLQRRLQTIGSYCPSPIRLLRATYTAEGRDLEWRLLGKYSKKVLWGEWFLLEPLDLDFIDRLFRVESLAEPPPAHLIPTGTFERICPKRRCMF